MTSQATPGEKIRISVSGLGVAIPTPVPVITLGGVQVNVETLVENAAPFFFPGVFAATIAVPASLSAGFYPVMAALGGLSSNTDFLPVATNGLSLSQTGETFRAVAGSLNALSRRVVVISTSVPINWTATAATISGGDWLQVNPAQGTSDPALTPPSITITADPSKLPAGDYYGTVTIRGSSSLVIVSVVLSLQTPDKSPGVVVDPTGLVFSGAPGGAAPAPKNVQISNPTTASLTFATTSTSSTTPAWFKFQPATGTVAPGQPTTVSFQPNAGLAAGTFTGTVTFMFSDGSTRAVNLLAVIAAGAGSSANTDASISLAGCTPTKLLPVFTQLGVNFSSPVAWPANIEAFIMDDCGAPLLTGNVGASFSNGDVPISLVSQQNGRWSVTWTPRGPVNANLTVTVKAQTIVPVITGTTAVSGSAPPNPNVPIVFSGGVVGTASYVASPAPGTLISLFGSALADSLASASSLPLPTQLVTTQLIVGGVNVPLVFVSAGQINAQLPYKLATKATYQVLVQRGNVISTPEPIVILETQPAVFSTDLSGKGQGHIYRIAADGLQTLAAAGAAVTAGDVLTIYCSGLGEVTPAGVVAGSPSPLDVLENAANAVTATIGGVTAKVLFAGLTPGFTGLYQVNLIVPAGVAPGDSVPLVLTAAGQVSQAVTLAVR
jgi:adhesin/invasin